MVKERERERERGRIIPECSITGLQSYKTELHFHSYVNPMPTTQWQQQQPAYTVHLLRLHVSYVHSRASDLITGRRSRTRRVAGVNVTYGTRALMYDWRMILGYEITCHKSRSSCLCTNIFWYETYARCLVSGSFFVSVSPHSIRPPYPASRS